MKIRNNIIGLSFLIVLSVSCREWLDVSPETEVKYEDLFAHKNGFKDQLTGVYVALCAEDLYGANLTFGMLDVLGQQYVWKQEAGKYYYLHRFEYGNPQSDKILKKVWSAMYNAIVNVNILLEGIEEFGDVLLENERNVYKGEAYALRAFLHFDLLRLFGKSYAAGAGEKAIPYVKDISKRVTPVSTVAEVVDKVIGDLEKAAVLLENDPVREENAPSDFLGNRVFHLNYYGVRALLARVYLYKNDKGNALKNAREVMESGKFPWVEQNKVSTNTREERDGIFKTECIFMLNNTMLKKTVDYYLKESSANELGNLLVMDEAVKDEIFETSLYGGFDWRYGYYFEKINNYYWGNTKLWQLSPEYNNRQPLIRISEMWLIAAECAATGKEALEYFNVFRWHRGFDAGYDLKEEGLTDDILKMHIGREYRKEFIGEGQWFFYCKRTDREDLPNVSVPFSRAYYVLPIPDQEMEYGNRN